MKPLTVLRRFLTALLAPVLFVSVSRPALASPGDVDPAFDPGIVDFSFGSGFVEKVLVQPDGKILIGGAFTTVQGSTRIGLARLNPNGSLDTTFVPPFFVAATIPFVANIALYPDGRVLVAGNGMNVPGGPVPYKIVRLLPNGSLDPTFTLQGMAGGVEGLWLMPDGRILIGGDFSNIGPATIRTIARLHPDGTLDPTFDLEPTTDGYGGTCRSIVVQPDGNILAGGELVLTVGGTTVTRMVRIRPDATVDTSFDPVFPQFEGAVVRSIALRPDGSMYIGGAFSSIDGVQKISVARLTAAGNLDTSFDVFGTIPGAIHDILLQSTGKLLITGNFFIPGDRRAIARVDATGAIDSFNPPDGLGPGGIGQALEVQPDGKVLVGGSFFQVGGFPRQKVVRFLDDPPPNSPPDAVDDAATTAEDTPAPINVLANDSDPDGHPLAISGFTPGAHGSVASGGGGMLIYSPDPDYFGPDAFTYTIDDGHGGSDTATVDVTVTPVNDPPVANADAYATPSNLPLAVAAPGVLGNDTDVDGDALGAFLFSPPASGILSLNLDGSFTYTPASGFTGIVTFVYAASDSLLTSNLATVTITVTAPMMKIAGSTDPVPGGTGFFTGFPKGPSIAGGIVSFLGLGTAGQQGVYGCLAAGPGDPCTPLANVETSIPGGSGTFTGFTSLSGAGPLTAFLGSGTGQAGVYSCLSAIPTEPCTPIVNLETPIPAGTGTFTGFGAIGLGVDAFEAAPAPILGFIGGGVGQQGAYVCTPTDPCTPVADRITEIPGGSGTFTGFSDLGLAVPFQPAPAPVVAFIGSGAGQQGVYSCDTAIPTDPCTPVSDRNTEIPGGTGNFTGFDRVAIGIDVLQPVVAFIGSGAGQKGVYRCGPGDPCTPVANLTTAIPGGSGTFTGFSAVSTSPGHVAFLAQGASGQAGIYVASTLQKVIAVGDVLDGKTVASLRLGQDGLNGNSLAFAATFTNGEEGIFLAALDLVPNAPPVAIDDEATVDEDDTVTIAVLANDADPDGDPLTVSGLTPAGHGSLAINGDGTVTYTPVANFHGSDAFTYTAADGQGGTATASVTIEVTPVNDPPVALGDSYSVAQNTTLTIVAPGVLANDGDLDGDALTALVVSGPAHGQLTLDPNGGFVYVPAAGYAGPDSFTYRASDGAATSSPATVSLTVSPTSTPLWHPTAHMLAPRAGHTATLLDDGRVLVVGGATGAAINTAEIYDPLTGTWAPTGSLKRPRFGHTATRLADGRVLVAGSTVLSLGDKIAASAEIWSPATGTWTLTGSLSRSHAYHTATLLPNGKVLVAGGTRSGLPQPSPTELFNPATGTWSLTGQLPLGRVGHQATRLADGRVLVSGGSTVSFFPTVLRRTDVYDPATGTWAQSGDLSVKRTGHTATLLADGRVVAAGGTGTASSPATAERWNPATGAWTPTAGLSPRAFHTAARLPDGNVLVAAGLDAFGRPTRTSARFDPAAGTWSADAQLATARVLHTMTLLIDGRVLVTGGLSGLASISSAEVYAP